MKFRDRYCNYLKSLILGSVIINRGIVLTKLQEQIPYADIQILDLNDDISTLSITLDNEYKFQLLWEIRENGLSKLKEIK